MGGNSKNSRLHEDHLQEDQSREKFSKAVALFPLYFQRLFARLMKRPVNEHIKMRRLARACEILPGKFLRKKFDVSNVEANKIEIWAGGRKR